jgi:drug/metabolite transporter (DMT)-like permease
MWPQARAWGFFRGPMTKSEADSSTLTGASGSPPSVISASVRTSALVALVAAAAIWGSTFVVTKILLDEAEPFFIAAARFVIALAVLWPLLMWRGREPAAVFFRPAFIALGLLGVVGNFGLQNLGLAYTGAADAALIIALTPVAIAALAAVLLGERLVPRQLAGITVSIGGVVLITGAGGVATPAAVLGDLLIAVSTLAWAGYTLLGKRLSPRNSAATIATAGIGWGVAFLLPLALVEAIVVSPPELSLLGVAALLYLGIAASAATFLLWNYALNAVGASVAGTFLNLIPVFGVAFALLAGESVSLLQLGGGAAVGFGVWLAASGGGRSFAAGSQGRSVT